MKLLSVSANNRIVHITAVISNSFSQKAEFLKNMTTSPFIFINFQDPISTISFPKITGDNLMSPHLCLTQLSLTGKCSARCPVWLVQPLQFLTGVSSYEIFILKLELVICFWRKADKELLELWFHLAANQETFCTANHPSIGWNFLFTSSDDFILTPPGLVSFSKAQFACVRDMWAAHLPYSAFGILAYICSHKL